ncbi:MAG: endonuclease [Bacteroidia bacterium]|nr:endonuclease [Bacteroidia bacterium]
MSRKKISLLISFAITLTSFAGTISIAPASLYTFGSCPVNYATAPQKYTVSGTGLTQNIVVQAPEHFEISITCYSGYTSNLQLIQSGGSVSGTIIYCRFSPYTSGSKTGSLFNSSAGCTTINISVSGTATATPASGTGASTYYNSISTTQTGAALKTSLYNKILGHTVTAYGSGSSGLWATYATTDPFYNGKVWDIYSTSICDTSPYEYTFSTNQCGTYSIEGDCYNREHSFPQSWFGSSSPMVSDMFHIYPTDGKVNGVRNNFPYGEVSSPTYTSLLGGKLGPNTFPGYSGTVFEPINEYKGDLARGYLYMATRYENLIAGWQTNGNANDVLNGNSFPVYDAWVVNLLIKWSNQDPPGVKEINRNNAVYGYQVNRNPYIDSPQYVYKVFGGLKPLEPTLASTSFIVKSNTATTALISWKCGNGNRRLVVARSSAPVSGLPVDSGYYQANNTFGSGTQIGSGNFVVYDGMGNTAQISGLNNSLVYYFTIVEFNGQGITANYLTGSVLSSTSVSLPVAWLTFIGNLNNDNNIQLEWSTASETNTSRFELFRSSDQINFESIGSVKAAGNSRLTEHYYFIDVINDDPNNSALIYLYKIKQWDKDGNFCFSKTIQIRKENMLSKITVEPNPFENDFRISCALCYGEAQIILTDLTGKTILQQQIKLKDDTTVPLPDNVSSGMYFLHVLQQSNQQIFKIIRR